MFCTLYIARHEDILFQLLLHLCSVHVFCCFLFFVVVFFVVTPRGFWKIHWLDLTWLGLIPPPPLPPPPPRPRFLVFGNDGYQKKSPVEGAVTTKLNGLVYTNRTEVKGLDGRIWDNADYMVPAKVRSPHLPCCFSQSDSNSILNTSNH